MTMSDNIQVGSVVQLNSGGPTMTVESIENNIAACVWFVNNDLKRAEFAITTIQIYITPNFF